MQEDPGRIIVIGASAGGIEALNSLVAALAPDLDAPVLVVQHMASDQVSNLPRILARSGPLAATFAADGEAMRPGRIYVAPPDHHLLVQGGRMLVRKGPKENRFRPSIDALFRSAAYACGPRTIGVVLSGALDDGTAGLWNIKCVGGTTIVQDPNEAAFPSMPQSALEQVDIDHCLPILQMGTLLVQLTRGPMMERQINTEDMDRMKLEVSVAAGGDAFREGIMRIGPPSPFSCPECHGVLMQVRDGKIMRFRCHTGHAYSSRSLLSALLERIEQDYGHAMASLEEASMLLTGIGKEYSGRGNETVAAAFLDHARMAAEQSDRLRDVVQSSALFDSELLSGTAGKD
jgi:two-component system, chemotaxis family, protein-glutamate methylesterase/glutaminase